MAYGDWRPTPQVHWWYPWVAPRPTPPGCPHCGRCPACGQPTAAPYKFTCTTNVVPGYTNRDDLDP